MDLANSALRARVRSHTGESGGAAREPGDGAGLLGSWAIGEEEQGGEERAGYGAELIEALATSLTAEFGRGFTPTNLRDMRLARSRDQRGSSPSPKRALRSANPAICSATFMFFYLWGCPTDTAGWRVTSSRR